MAYCQLDQVKLHQKPRKSSVSCNPYPRKAKTKAESKAQDQIQR